MNKKPMKHDVALVRLETLCAASEQCEYDLRQKLKKWGVGGDDAEKIIESLEERRFFDNGRFAQAFVNDKLRFNHWGQRKIRQSLRLKRVAADLIDGAMYAIDDDDFTEVLRDILRTRARRMPQPLSYDDKMRLARFAISRGFEISEILSIVNEPGLCDE